MTSPGPVNGSAPAPATGGLLGIAFAGPGSAGSESSTTGTSSTPGATGVSVFGTSVPTGTVVVGTEVVGAASFEPVGTVVVGAASFAVDESFGAGASLLPAGITVVGAGGVASLSESFAVVTSPLSANAVVVITRAAINSATVSVSILCEIFTALPPAVCLLISKVPPFGRFVKTFFKFAKIPAMRITLDEQKAQYRTHARVAAEQLIDVLTARIDEYIELGYQRAFETVGVEEYGDSTYWKSDLALDDEAAAEIADAIFYQHIPIARAAGDLPSPEHA